MIEHWRVSVDKPGQARCAGVIPKCEWELGNDFVKDNRGNTVPRRVTRVDKAEYKDINFVAVDGEITYNQFMSPHDTYSRDQKARSSNERYQTYSAVVLQNEITEDVDNHIEDRQPYKPTESGRIIDPMIMSTPPEQLIE